MLWGYLLSHHYDLVSDESLSCRDSVRFGTLCFFIMKLGADVIHEQFEISVGDIHFKGVYF